MGNLQSYSKKSYYDVLGVHQYASDKEITQAFHQLSLKYHPDRNNLPEATAKFKECSEAYHILVKSKNAQSYEAVDQNTVRKNLKITDEIRKKQKAAMDELEELKKQNAAFEDFFSCSKCKADISDGGILFDCRHKSCISCSNTSEICHRCKAPIRKRQPMRF